MANNLDSKALREVVRLLERKLGLLNEVQASCCAVTFGQCHAIVEIGRAGSISLNELADILGLDKSTMSRTINQLVIDEMAVRETTAADRRYISITLTPKGLETYGAIQTTMEAYFTEVYQAIPEDKRAQVIESLQILLRSLPVKNCC